LTCPFQRFFFLSLSLSLFHFLHFKSFLAFHGQIFEKDDDAELGLAPAGGSSGDLARQDKVTEVLEVIENSQQFFNWYADIEESMERGREDVYRAYLQEVYCYRDACAEALLKIEHAMALLNQLETNFDSVSKKSSTLQDACEKLLEEQVCELDAFFQKAFPTDKTTETENENRHIW